MQKGSVCYGERPERKVWEKLLAANGEGYTTAGDLKGLSQRARRLCKPLVTMLATSRRITVKIYDFNCILSIEHLFY